MPKVIATVQPSTLLTRPTIQTMVLLEAKLQTGLEPTVIICSAAVSAGDRARSPDKAMVFLVAMLQIGLVPNAIICSTAFSARDKAKPPDRR